MTEGILTLETFQKSVLRPMVIRHIENGQLDLVIKKEFAELINIYSEDNEILNLIVDRYVIIRNKK